MATELENIIQAEFFHVGGENIATLAELLAECQGRAIDGAQIKTTVRFFDKESFLTDLALKLAQAKMKRDELVTLLITAGKFKQIILAYRYHRLHRKIGRMRERNKFLVIKRLCAIAETSQEIGIECPDRSFRLIRRNETHELLERVWKATSVWIFVFEPNDLLVEKNFSVTSVM